MALRDDWTVVTGDSTCSGVVGGPGTHGAVIGVSVVIVDDASALKAKPVVSVVLVVTGVSNADESTL